MNRTLLLLATLACGSAFAGENKYLGTITVSGSSLTNISTAVPFAIPPTSKITIVCDAAVRILTDSTSVATSGATKGLPVAANVLFPTSVGARLATVGTTQSALVAVIGTGNCDVWQRAGTE